MLEVDKKKASLVVAFAGDLVLGFKGADGQLGFPCGKIEPEEAPIEAAVRELREETGLNLQPCELSYVITMYDKDCLVSVYEAEASLCPVEPLPEFAHEGEAKWYPIETFKSIKSSYRQFNLKVLALLGE